MADTKTLTPDMLTKEGLETLWGVIGKTFEPSVEGKGLSTNDFTDEEKEKLETMLDRINDEVDGAWNIKGTVTAVAVEIAEDAEAGTTAYSGNLIPKSAVEEVVGNVYSVVVADGGMFGTHTTTDHLTFVADEQGSEYPSGTNIVYTDNGWDAVAGHYDFSNMVKKSDIDDISDEEIDKICSMEEETPEVPEETN
ncbi:MAG: hypothetical protein K2L48_03230 [Mycoplasmoidaceae bacterium]|nr:hypothetical protein [Mycoplasmoidaceae bacterium]